MHTVLIPPKPRIHDKQLQARLGCDFADFIGHEWRANDSKRNNGHGFIAHMITLVKSLNEALIQEITEVYDDE